MRKLIVKVALVLALALPFAGMANANPLDAKINQRDYTVYLWKSPGSEAEFQRLLRDPSIFGGHICRLCYYRCEIQHGTKVKVQEQWSRMSRVQSYSKNSCHGWIRNEWLTLIPVPKNTRVVNAVAGAPGKFWQQKKVPIFDRWDVVYKARDSMRDHGNFDEHRSNVECSVPVGTNLEFISKKAPGSVRVKSPQCTGWILEWNLNWQ